MGHPQVQPSVAANVLKDTLVPIVRLRTRALLEGTDNLVRTMAPSPGQQAIVHVLVLRATEVLIARSHCHVPKHPMVKSVKMVELQLVSLDLVGVPAQMVTRVTTAKRLLPAT